MDGKSKIVGCNFTDNGAIYRAGAVELNEAGAVLLRNNTFTRNTVINPSTRFADGGAVYFACDPTKTDK